MILSATSLAAPTDKNFNISQTQDSAVGLGMLSPVTKKERRSDLRVGSSLKLENPVIDEVSEGRKDLMELTGNSFTKDSILSKEDEEDEF
jgi:hypothetical protein